MLLALTLIGQGKIGIHPDCEDGVDNNGDGLADFEDENCRIYPYNDGNGEEPTPLNQMNQNQDGYAYGNEFNALLELNPNSPWAIDICNAPYIPYDNSAQPKAWLAYSASILSCSVPPPPFP